MATLYIASVASIDGGVLDIADMRTDMFTEWVTSKQFFGIETAILLVHLHGCRWCATVLGEFV